MDPFRGKTQIHDVEKCLELAGKKGNNMDSKRLAAAVWAKAETVDEIIVAGETIPEIYAISDDLRDVKFLLSALTHIVNGKTVAEAFGAPGDWGYGTPIGNAIASKG